MALQGQPSNTNPLQITGYRFFIQRLPHVVYFGQAGNLPGFSFGSIDYSTPMSPVIPIPGDSVTFDPLSVKFIVDENMANWKEIYHWVQALARIKELNLEPREGQEATVSDAVLYILTSNKNVNLKVFFRDLFPVSLTGLDFDSSVTDLDPFIAEATFKYCYYEFEVLETLDLSNFSDECPTAPPSP